MADVTQPTATGFRPSYWETTTFLRPADVLVVGAGLTGLQAALNLKRANPKLDVLVIERAPVPRGASTRNAGFACFGGPTELLADLDAYGEAAVLDTVRQRYAGVRALEENFSRRRIGWHKYGGFEVVDDSVTAETVRHRLEELNSLLAEATGRKQTWSATDDLNGHPTWFNPLEAQLHPGKLVGLLLEDAHRAGVRFLFGATVTAVRGGGADLQELGTVNARQVLLTVNAFAKRLLPDRFAGAIRPVRNQIILSRKIPKLKLQGCYHYHEGYVYFRNVGPDRLLIGGARHLAGTTSETDTFGANPDLTAVLVEHLNRWLPEERFTEADFPTRWSGIIAQGNGKTPILERTDDGVLVAGRLAGMGVALSAALAESAAEILVDASPR